MKILKEVIDENWQVEVLENIFWEEDLSTLKNDYENEKEYKLVVSVERGEEIITKE